MWLGRPVSHEADQGPRSNTMESGEMANLLAPTTHVLGCQIQGILPSRCLQLTALSVVPHLLAGGYQDRQTSVL